MSEELNYHSLAGLVEAAARAGEPLSALVLRQQAAQLEQSEAEVYRHMQENFRVMAACIEPGVSARPAVHQRADGRRRLPRCAAGSRAAKT